MCVLWLPPVECCCLVSSGCPDNLDKALQGERSGGSRCREAAQQGHQETWGKLHFSFFFSCISALSGTTLHVAHLSRWSEWWWSSASLHENVWVCRKNEAASELFCGSCDFPHSTELSCCVVAFCWQPSVILSLFKS